MKNKEIENILDKCTPYLFGDEVDKLLSYIEQLEEEIHKKEAMYDSLAVDYRLSQEQNEQLEKENQQLKKQKDDVVEYIKSYNLPKDLGHLGEAPISIRELKDLLRMLGEIDNE